MSFRQDPFTRPVIRDIIRDIVRPVFGLPSAVSDITFWLTNVLNLNTTVGTGPAVFDRGGSPVTVQTNSGLETLPDDVIASPGLRLSYDTDESGVTTGAEEITAQNDRDFSSGTVGNWAVFNGNGATIEYDSATGALLTTCGNSNNTGAFLDRAFIPNIGLDTIYEVTLDLWVGTVAGNVTVDLGEANPGHSATITPTSERTTYTVQFKSRKITPTSIDLRVYSSANENGKTFFVDDISTKLVTPAWLNTVSKADSTLLHPVKVDSESGADVYLRFDKWEDSHVYAAGSYATDFDGAQNKYYLTANGGTSSGTGVADDTGVTDWVEQGNYSNTGQLPGLASNPAFTQYFVLPEAPANQTISLGTGDFRIFAWESGSAAISANTATGTGFGTATPGAPIDVNITGAGTVDVVITGTPLFVGLHNSEFTAVSTLNPTTTVAVPASSETSAQVFSSRFVRCRLTGGLYPEVLYSAATNTLEWDGTDLTFTDGSVVLTSTGASPNDDAVVDTTDGKLYVSGTLKDTNGALNVVWGTLTIIGNISDLAESDEFDPTDQTWKEI